MTSCGMLVPFVETCTRFFLASSMPLRIASGTSEDLPKPKPTVPFSSPTTTRAVNLKVRPPLTVLETRLSETTSPLQLELSGVYKLSHKLQSSLKLQSGFAGALRQSLNTAVVEIAAAIEHDVFDAGLPSTLGNQLTDLLGSLNVAAVNAKVLLVGRSRSQRAAGSVINDLRIDVLAAAEHIKAGTCGGAEMWARTLL